MKKFDYVIKDEAGIHARPAGLLVREASKFSSRIVVAKDERSADCRKLFALMSLGVKHGDRVSVSCEGKDEELAAAAMERFFADNL